METSPARPRPAEILLAEDNEDDVVLLQTAFRHAGLPVNLHRVENGKECLDFLGRTGSHSGVPWPDLLILDLNLPIMDGRQVLAELVADERARPLPVVILTTSANERDIQQMYALRCSSFIVKPLDFDAFENAVRLICDYWFNLVALPPKENPPGNGP